MDHTRCTIKAVIILAVVLLARNNVFANNTWESSLYQPGEFYNLGLSAYSLI